MRAFGMAIALFAGSGGGDETVEIAGALKAAQVSSRASETAPGEERDGEASLWRLRVTGRAKPASWLGAEAAWEMRARGASGAQSEGTGVLPSAAAPPWRMRAWDWEAASTDRAELRHEVDRAVIFVHLPRTEISAGRQAIGWGRGLLFTALDPFPAFGALEIDREWKRGVDAVRVELRAFDAVSIEGVAAGGEERENQVLAGRVRGYTALFDAELVGGRRSTDRFAGISLSAPIYGAEIHAEATGFRAERPIATGGIDEDDRLTAVAVAGGSYRFDVARGPILIAEWHYNGFGVRSPEEVVFVANEPDFRTRVMRGDLRTLGRQATGVQLSYPWTDELSTSVAWLHAPLDGSGLAGPSLSWLVSDRVSFGAGAYFSYGARPEGLIPRSEYGGLPSTVYVHLALSDSAGF